MEFRNHTPFPALAFEGIDPRNRPFHVLVLRQTLNWDDDGQLDYADKQSALNVVDAYFGEVNASEVRQESDLCQYKPRCDVIVNATAYAPGGKPRRRFKVGLRLARPDIAVALPEPPQGLNPLQPARFEDRQAWKVACELARNARRPGAVLIDKTLVVTGERWFVRRLWPLRLLAALAKWVSLGLLRLPTWRLSMPRQTASVPVRGDLAFGGQCRIDAEDKAAKRIGKRHRLKPEQQAAFPGAVALDAFAANPVGRGWALGWYLKATRTKRVPAPRVEHPDRPITARHFARAQAGKLDDKTGNQLLAGLGIRPKGHPERAKLLGTVDDAFVKSDAWLPKDFDFAVWNAAWPDQQTDHLQGDEVIELTNLSAPGSPGAATDAQGNTRLKLELPRHDCFALVRLMSGEMCELPLAIDTVLVEPETRTLTLVWRLVFMKDAAIPVRVLEARMRSFAERDAQRASVALLQAFSARAAKSVAEAA